MKQVPLTLPRLAYLVDHRVEGRAVLPAVEALELLAAAVLAAAPGVNVWQGGAAEFLRFLETGEGAAPAAVWATLEPWADGDVRAALCSRAVMGKTGLKRSVEHVRAVFGAGAATGAGAGPSPPPFDSLPAGPHFALDAARLYAELVPFGPAYHNASGTVLLGADGATAELAAPPEPTTGDRALGSPFPLDAAFHLACAWGQRATGRVLFPTGYAARRIHAPIPPGSRVRCQVRLREQGEGWAAFDLWLFGADARLREEARVVKMQDLFHGRRQPPAWVRA